MIFYEGMEIRPRSMGGEGFFGVDIGGPMRRTEFWSCYFCGKVRAVRQWKRAEVLELSDEKQDPQLGTWSPDQLDSVPGEKLLPDGWGFHDQEFEYKGQKHKLRMLGCAECLDDGEGDDVSLETKEEDD